MFTLNIRLAFAAPCGGAALPRVPHARCSDSSQCPRDAPCSAAIPRVTRPHTSIVDTPAQSYDSIRAANGSDRTPAPDGAAEFILAVKSRHSFVVPTAGIRGNFFFGLSAREGCATGQSRIGDFASSKTFVDSQNERTKVRADRLGCDAETRGGRTVPGAIAGSVPGSGEGRTCAKAGLCRTSQSALAAKHAPRTNHTIKKPRAPSLG